MAGYALFVGWSDLVPGCLRAANRDFGRTVGATISAEMNRQLGEFEQIVGDLT